MTTIWKALSIALITLLVSGCSSLSKYSKVQKPTASIAGVSIAHVSMSDITLNTRVRINNPNPFDLKTAGLNFDLSVQGNPLANVSQPNNALSLKAENSTEVTIPVTLAFTNIAKTAANLADQSEVPYAIKGNVNVAVPVLGNISAPFEFASVIPVPTLPKISLNGVKLVRATITSVELQVEMLVNNPNAFAINLNTIGFDVFMNNRSICSSKVNSVSLNKKSQNLVSIPLTLNLKQLGATMFAMLNADKELDFKLDGNANVAPALAGFKPEKMSFSSEKRVSF